MLRKPMLYITVVSLLGLLGSASADIVTHYGLDETSGSTANDDSGNGNNGTVSDHSWGVAGANAGTGTAVHVGEGGDLTGYAPGVPGNFTLMLWINPSYGGYNRIVNFGEAGHVLHFSHENGGWELSTVPMEYAHWWYGLRKSQQRPLMLKYQGRSAYQRTWTPTGMWMKMTWLSLRYTGLMMCPGAFSLLKAI